MKTSQKLKQKIIKKVKKNANKIEIFLMFNNLFNFYEFLLNKTFNTNYIPKKRSNF